MGNTLADQTYREVMTVDPPPVTTPFEVATRDFAFRRVWSRPGLSRRDRRLVTLACVGAADAPQPIEDHVYAALNSGDLSLEEMLEFVLHFAVYSGWPSASHVEERSGGNGRTLRRSVATRSTHGLRSTMPAWGQRTSDIASRCGSSCHDSRCVGSPRDR